MGFSKAYKGEFQRRFRMFQSGFNVAYEALQGVPGELAECLRVFRGDSWVPVDLRGISERS